MKNIVFVILLSFLVSGCGGDSTKEDSSPIGTQQTTTDEDELFYQNNGFNKPPSVPLSSLPF